MLCHDFNDFAQFLVFNEPKSRNKSLMAIPSFSSRTFGYGGLKRHDLNGMIGDERIRHDVDWQETSVEFEAGELEAGDK
jgi:hypothetical protein